MKRLPRALLSRRFEKNIRDRLSSNGFSQEDFTIFQDTDVNDSSIICVNIKYNFGKFYFNANIDPESQYIDFTYNPGDITATTSEVDCSVEEYLERLTTWVFYLREDLKTSALGRRVYENEQKIKEIEERINQQFKDNQDVYFTREEAFELSEKLNVLEELFKQKIAEEQLNTEKLNVELERLHEEMELLKEQVDYLPKPNWMKSLGTKFINWSARNPKAAKQLGTVVLQAALPENIENALPQDWLPEPEKQK